MKQNGTLAEQKTIRFVDFIKSCSYSTNSKKSIIIKTKTRKELNKCLLLQKPLVRSHLNKCDAGSFQEILFFVQTS